MKPKEIRELSTTDVAKKLEETYSEMREMRFQHATRQLTNTARFGLMRQDIARLKTILRERELSEASTE